MRKIGKHLVACALLFFLTAGYSSAQNGARFATIDLRKAFDNYWKTKQADANLKDRAADLDKESKSLSDQYQKTQDNYKKMVDTANDQAVSVEERERRKKSAETELLKLKEIQASLEQFTRQAKVTLGEQQRRMRDNILVEIRDIIKAKAKAGNFTHVVDTAAQSFSETPVVIYSSGDHDITDAVLAQLNSTAPSSGLKPEEPKSGKKK